MPECTAVDRSSTRLGDWYANRLNIAQRRYIIVVNAHALLAVVVPARDLATLPARITDAVDALLRTIGVASAARVRELNRMNSVCTAAARDPSVISSMNALAQRAYDELYDLPHRPGRTLTHIAALLAGAPLARLGYRTPAEVASSVLMQRPAPRAAG